jgi:hypothetical protein
VEAWVILALPVHKEKPSRSSTQAWPLDSGSGHAKLPSSKRRLVSTLNSLAETRAASDCPQTDDAPSHLPSFPERLPHLLGGVWPVSGAEPDSCLAAGNEARFALKVSSFWFPHRSAPRLALLQQSPTADPFSDIGRSHGSVAPGNRSGELMESLAERHREQTWLAAGQGIACVTSCLTTPEIASSGHA